VPERCKCVCMCVWKYTFYQWCLFLSWQLLFDSMCLKKNRQTDLQWHRLPQKSTHCNTLCSNLNLYREIWVAIIGRFPGCSIFSGICHMIVWMICCVSSVWIKLMTVSTENARSPTSTYSEKHRFLGISRENFKLNQNLDLNLFHEIPGNLSFSIL